MARKILCDGCGCELHRHVVVKILVEDVKKDAGGFASVVYEAYGAEKNFCFACAGKVTERISEVCALARSKNAAA